jgi:phosphoglucosamine mutase
MQQSVEYDDVKQALAKAKDELGSDSTLIARKSGTEPVVKLRVEARDGALVEKWSKILFDLISTHQK